jgi:5-methylcytosine-specific restriction endonuclease McrA
MIEGYLARNDSMRVRVEAREAAYAETPPPESADRIYAKAVAAALRVDGGPHARTRVCRVCLQAFPIGDFRSGPSRSNREFRHVCRSCYQSGYQSQARAFAEVRKRLAEIEVASLECQKCGNKKPRICFRDGERYCLNCRVEILEVENAALRERVPTGIEWARERARRDRHANPEKYARTTRRRDQMILAQADGTLTRDVVGKLFAEAEGKPCPYCGVTMDRRTKSLDHIVPVSKGGMHSAANVLICCLRCNTRKGSLEFQDWLARLEGPFASTASREYIRRYGVLPLQSVLPLQFGMGMASN